MRGGMELLGLLGRLLFLELARYWEISVSEKEEKIPYRILRETRSPRMLTKSQ